MLKGQNLFAEVAACQTDAFWWLGQHSFIVKMGGTSMLIDPFLTDLERRNVPPLFDAADANIISLTLCTHDHLDHLDPFAVSELAQKTQTHFIAPKAHENRMLSLGVSQERMTLLNDGESCQRNGLKITGIKSAHEFFDETPEGYFPFMGYVIEAGGKTLYHAGDTVWWEGLQRQLSQWHFDVALVPINGRDAVRYKTGIIGNMTYQEAADLLGGLEVKLSVPTHYDMFDGNREDPQLFVDYMAVKYPGRDVWVGSVTEEVQF